MKQVRKIVLLIVASIALVVYSFSGVSRWLGRRTAESVMSPYRKLVVYKYGYFSLLGSKEQHDPSWVFIYDDPRSFDGSVVHVQVSFLGNLLAVYPPVILNDKNDEAPSHREEIPPNDRQE